MKGNHLKAIVDVAERLDPDTRVEFQREMGRLSGLTLSEVFGADWRPDDGGVPISPYAI
jgi:hypothetical protein